MSKSKSGMAACVVICMAALPAHSPSYAQTQPIQRAQPGQRPPPTRDTRHLTESAQIVDPREFGRPVVVATVQLPKGWRSIGGVNWSHNTSCVTNQLQWGWTALGPDSLTAIEKIPGFNWQVEGTQNQMNPCPVAPIRNAQAFLEATAARLRPNARVINYENEPQLAQSALQRSKGQGQWDAGRLTIAYTTPEGIPMHEQLIAALSFTNVQGTMMGGTGIVDTHRAPAGRLDRNLNQRVGDTIRMNPEWSQLSAQRMQAKMQDFNTRQQNSINDWHTRQMTAINARGEADRAALRMRSNKEVASIYNSIASSTSATNDRMHGRSVDGVREVDTYRGTDGNPVQSSIHGGSRVFQDPNNPNRAYSTNDPYHNPSNAVELQRAR